MSEQTRIRMTATEFFALPEDRHPIQLIEGELLEMAAPIPKHQRLVRKTLILLDSIIPNGEVFDSPIALYLDEDNVPEPDVVWVKEGGRCEIKETQLEGAPALVVEVLSPATARYDKTVKFLLYERHAIPEYWIIDPSQETIEVWVLLAEEYSLQDTYKAAASFQSKTLGDLTVDSMKIWG